MTLDELIEDLQEIRRLMPASGSADVIGVRDRVSYSRGVVLIGEPSDDDDDEYEIEI